MKKNYCKLISFLLVFMATLVVISCRKEVEIEPTAAKDIGKKALYERKLKGIDLDSLKKVFYEKSLDKKLTDEIDLGSITWSPDWASSFHQVRDSNSYLYVPLIPALKKAGSSMKIELVNQRQFLIVKNNSQFQRATFTGINNKSKALVFDFKTLDGSLLLQDLETNKSFKYDFSKGSYINQTLSTTNKSSSDVQTSGWQLECHTEYSCTFNAHCDGTVYIYSDPTGCDYPDRDLGVGTCSVSNWSLSYRTPYQVCNNINYPDPPPIPTDPGGGGGSPVSPVSPDPDRPCRLARVLKLPESSFMTTISNDLKSKLNLNYETGYYIRDNSDGWPTWSLTQGLPGQASIPIEDFPAYLKGLIHTHYAGPDMLSIFSPGDLKAMYYIVKSPKVDIPAKDFYLGVIVPHEGGASYILTITDLNKFLAWESVVQSTAFSFSYNLLIKPNASNISNETGFLKLIKDHGLSLLKADKDNPQSLKKLELDANLNVKTTNCN